MPKIVISDDDCDINLNKNCIFFDKISDGALHIIKDNNKLIVVALNKCETHKNARHHEIMDSEDAHYYKILELEHRRIISSEETNCGYI